MTVSDYVGKIPQTKRRIEEIFHVWGKELGLGWWRTHLVFDAERKPDSFECAGECRANWEYMEATFTFYLPACVDTDDEQLEYIVVHELIHALVKEMRWTDDNGDNIRHEERVVTTLAKAFQWVRDAAQSGRWNKQQKNKKAK